MDALLDPARWFGEDPWQTEKDENPAQPVLALLAEFLPVQNTLLASVNNLR
jgi:hypothetical protein